MNSINPLYLSKKIIDYVIELIDSYDLKHYSDLNYAVRCEFAALLIKASGRQSECEFITESNDLDMIIGSFTKMMLGGSDEIFLEVMKNNAVNYFDQTMNNIFDKVFQDREEEREEWNLNIGDYGNPDEACDNYREKVA